MEGQPQERCPGLDAQMLADFTAQPLLNKSEARVFAVLDKLVIELAPPGWQVMAQVSLGEIIRRENKAAPRPIPDKGSS